MRPKLAKNEAEELKKSLEAELYRRCEKDRRFKLERQTAQVKE